MCWVFSIEGDELTTQSELLGSAGSTSGAVAISSLGSSDQPPSEELSLDELLLDELLMEDDWGALLSLSFWGSDPQEQSNKRVEKMAMNFKVKSLFYLAQSGLHKS